MTLPPRVDHDLARLAAETLDRIRDPRSELLPDEIIRRLKGLPALLQTSGPLATLAFFAAKAGDVKPLAKAYALVGAALREQAAAELGERVPASASFSSFVLAFTGDDVPPDGLSRASARLEEFALWLRRLAEATEQEQARLKHQVAASPTVGMDA